MLSYQFFRRHSLHWDRTIKPKHTGISRFSLSKFSWRPWFNPCTSSRYTYFRFSAVWHNHLRNKHLAEYLRNNSNELATVRFSAVCGAMLSNNSFICKYNLFFRKNELSRHFLPWKQPLFYAFHIFCCLQLHNGRKLRCYMQSVNWHDNFTWLGSDNWYNSFQSCLRYEEMYLVLLVIYLLMRCLEIAFDIYLYAA